MELKVLIGRPKAVAIHLIKPCFQGVYGWPRLPRASSPCWYGQIRDKVFTLTGVIIKQWLLYAYNINPEIQLIGWLRQVGERPHESAELMGDGFFLVDVWVVVLFLALFTFFFSFLEVLFPGDLVPETYRLRSIYLVYSCLV